MNKKPGSKAKRSLRKMEANPAEPLPDLASTLETVRTTPKLPNRIRHA